MKITAQLSAPPPPSFQPVIVTVTLETQAEVNALYQIGNYSWDVAELISKRESNLTTGLVNGVAISFYDALRAFKS
jgi:hypothetical protein